MHITVQKSTATDIGESKFSVYGCNKDSWTYRSTFVIDLAELKRSEIDDLRTMLKAHIEVRGVKTLLTDIETWTAILDGANEDDVRPRSPRQLCPLLIRLMGKIEGHRVYEKLDSLNDVWIGYYVEQIKYVERRETRDQIIPEHTNVIMFWQDWRGQFEKTVTFWAEDCRGIPVVEAMARKGLYLETANLRKKYLAEIKRWSALTKQIGKQCTAYGMAYDGGVDGNRDKSDWYSRRDNEYKMGRGKKVMIDIFKESTEDSREGKDHVDTYFWTLKSYVNLIQAEGKKRKRTLDEDGEAELLESLDVPTPVVEIPIHPYCIVFDLSRHLRLSIHVTCLADYVFKKDIIERLILPSELKDLVKMLIEHKETQFQDIVEGKSGGAVVLLTGRPGVGKTLTAEVYAESEEKGLYSVQCSQLGIEPQELESQLLKVFTRAKRWGAVLLLDEADVYVRERASDLTQNAIVGVFLRVLEYQDNILFLTTNRPDDVDDAIASRCVARLNYQPPTAKDQARIWRVLADSFKIELSDEEIGVIVGNSEGISGRDVKNLLKLAALVSKSEGHPVNAGTIEFCKRFKPTL